MLETWLKHVNVAREKAYGCDVHDLDRSPTLEDDDVFIERRKNLKQFSTPKFTRWRLKHHVKTVGDYVTLKEELKRQLKKWRRS